MNTSKKKLREFFDELRAEDKKYAAYTERFNAFANFLFFYEYQKGIQGITQEELAEMLRVRLGAIWRFEEMKYPPKYDMLVKVSKILGDSLFLSPMASMSITLQIDLHNKARFLAKHLDKDITDLMYEAVRAGIESDYEKLHRNLQEPAVAENEVTHKESSLELAGK